MPDSWLLLSYNCNTTCEVWERLVKEPQICLDSCLQLHWTLRPSIVNIETHFSHAVWSVTSAKPERPLNRAEVCQSLGLAMNSQRRSLQAGLLQEAKESVSLTRRKMG